MMRHVPRKRSWLAAAVLPLLMAGCSSFGTSSMNPLNWFSSGSTNKPNELTEIKPTLTMARAWGASVGGGGIYVFTPAIVGNTVYAAGADGSLAAFDLQTGAPRWRVTADRAGLSAGVGANDELIVVATVKGEVLAFDDKGREKWRTQVSSEVLARPLVTDREVLVRSNDNRIFAFSIADGKRQWVFQRPPPALVLRNAGGMTSSLGQAYVGFPGGKMVALSLSNGTVRWEATVAQSKGTTELERIADITSAPILSGREICAVAFQGRAGCFDANNGQPLWTRDLSSSAGLTLDDRYIFLTDEKSAVVALSRSSGASLWKQEKLLYRNVSAPVSVGRAVIAGDYQGILHALSREDGSFIGRQPTDGSPVFTAPQLVSVASKDGFVVQTQKGGIFVFTL
jgi:outer membrane protein assembly factor BamB